MSGIVLEINPFKGYDQETGETTYHSASEFAGGFTSAAEGSLIRFLRIEDDNGNDITPEELRFQWKTGGAGLYGENGDEYDFPFFGRGGQDISLSAGDYSSGKITITNTNNGNALPPEINITDSSQSANSFGITYSKSTDPENFRGGGISGWHTTQYRVLANGETIATSTSGNITTESSPFITTYMAEVEYMDAQGYVRTITSDEAITLGLISEDPAMEFSSFHDVHLLPLNQYSWPGFDFISQDRELSDGNTGLSLYTGDQEILISGNRYSLSENNDPGSNYLFSDPLFLNQATWIDLDGNVTRDDGSSPLQGEQGNQSGDDLISNFDRVDYNGEFQRWDPNRQGYSFALLSDEQGQYVLIQDRKLDDGDDGTDTLRNINQLSFQFGEDVALSPLNSWGDPNHNYLFSDPLFLNQATWIDLDGNVTRDDGSSPLQGEQGNQSGDDLISNFDRVDYNGEFQRWDPNRQGYSFALLSDEQGQYVLIQDRKLDDGDDGTDTLRNINQLSFQFGEDVALSPLNSWGDPNHNYLFSDPLFLNQATWIDLDGNVTRDDGSSPLQGEQGNQSGDDLISNFDRVDYNGEFQRWDPNRQGYSFALLSDEQGQYVLIQDRKLDDGDDGTDTLRNINQLSFQFGEDVALSPLNSWGDPNHNYLFSDPLFLNQATWIDLDGNVTRDDGSSPLQGEQGNQSGDDLISNFDRVDYNGEFQRWDPNRQGYSFALLSDEQGQYVLIQDRKLDDGDDGTDTLRNINQLSFQFGEDVALSPLNSWGDPNHNYLFSDPLFLNQATWIDLDGNVTRDDGSSPLQGEQGNQSGDDLIIGFDRIYYSDSEPWHSSVSDLAIARLQDEQGEYFIVQDRLAGPDNQGTDTLRRVNTLDIHGFEWDLTGSGEGNYYFSEQNYNDRDIWIDLDGNVTREDGSSPLQGEQGNQSGDDLIIGFDRIYYSDSEPWHSSVSDLAIARLQDEQGEYFIVQDRLAGPDNQGTDTLRRVNTLDIHGFEWDLTGSGEGNYYFSEQNYNDRDIWIDLDGNVTREDGSSPLQGEQGNQSGDDLIIGFDRIYYSDSEPWHSSVSDLAIARLQDEQGEYFIVQDRLAGPDNQGTDTLRRVNTLDIHGFEWDLTGSGEGNYYFSEQNYNDRDIWIDLDGNVTRDDGSSPLQGEQGNQRGDDLIIGFEELRFDGLMSDYRITKARDSEGYFYKVEDNSYSYGSDTLRNVGSIVFDDSVYLFDPSTNTDDRALHLQALLTSESLTLPQVAVLGDSVDHHTSYSLLITGESLKDGYTIESADLTLHFDPLLFGTISASDVRIGGDLPIANAVKIDNEAGTLRLAAASLSALDAGDGVSTETVIASISLDFDEAALATIEKNADGSFVTNPLSFSLSANADETVFSKDFVDATGLLNREIVTLNDLGGYVAVDSEDVTLYEAKINFEQQGDGLVLGTQRVIGADASFTNLIRSGDTLTTSVDWLNVGNIQANNLNYGEVYNQNATLASADFSQTSVASGSFIDGVFVKDARESTTLTTAIKVTGQAGNVLDLSDGIVSIEADGSETFTNAGKGSSNLITFQGDLNYDGRVSMKDLAYLNAGAARQQTAIPGDNETDTDANGIVDASLAKDVDADFNGKIDLADLAILDNDWGKSLHTGDEAFHGSADISWSELDNQGDSSTWDNDSFKDQNATEAASDHVGSLESPTANGVIGADGNTSASDNDITGTEFQDPIVA